MRAHLGRAADLLTVGRLVAAPALALTVAVGRLDLAATLLAGSWLSDALDGQAARASGGRTRLGSVDLLVDTAVGASALVGLAFAGELPVLPTAALLAVLGGGFLVLRNPAPSMALQAVGYGWLLWVAWNEGEAAVWLPLATATGLALVLHRRLLATVMPAFLHGLAHLSRRGERFEL